MTPPTRNSRHPQALIEQIELRSTGSLDTEQPTFQGDSADRREPAQSTARPDHSMTRDDERHRVSTEGLTDGS
jgi:hypothetical protein